MLSIANLQTLKYEMKKEYEDNIMVWYLTWQYHITIWYYDIMTWYYDNMILRYYDNMILRYYDMILLYDITI